MAYSGTKFEVATSTGLGGDAFKMKYIIRPLTLTLGLGLEHYHENTLVFFWKFKVANKCLFVGTDGQTDNELNLVQN